MRPKEIPVCGPAAVQALFDRDPAAIKRLYFDYQTSRRMAKLSSYLAKQKRIYRVVLPDELEKIAGTVHHGGVVAVIETKPLPEPKESDVRAWAGSGVALLLLDRIGNSHNLGAIARTAAYFGIPHLVLPDHPQQAVPSEASYRVAEGGLEHLQLWQVSSLADFCTRLRGSGYAVLGASVSAQARPIQRRTAARERAGAAAPCALVLGNEEAGLAPEVAAACTELIRIPGHGTRVESLNVSVAAAVLIWELWGRS